MLGEELNGADVTARGLLGDRQFAVVDATTGKVAGGKNPRSWGNFLDFRAGCVEQPQPRIESARRPLDASRWDNSDQRPARVPADPVRSSGPLRGGAAAQILFMDRDDILNLLFVTNLPLPRAAWPEEGSIDVSDPSILMIDVAPLELWLTH